MVKILLAGLLLAILFFYAYRRIGAAFAGVNTNACRSGFIWLEADPDAVRHAGNAAIRTAVTGGFLLLLTLLLGMKIPVLLLLLPLSFYLMGQLVVAVHHVHSTRRRKIGFNPQSSVLWVSNGSGGGTGINLYHDIRSVRKVSSVQRNQHVLFGYYELEGQDGQLIRMSYLLSENVQNRFFFETLENAFPVRYQTVLFPLL